MADTEGAVQQETEKQGIHTVAYATLYLYATCSAKCVRSPINFLIRCNICVMPKAIILYSSPPLDAY